jgi:hypothetical protein
MDTVIRNIVVTVGPCCSILANMGSLLAAVYFSWVASCREHQLENKARYLRPLTDLCCSLLAYPLPVVDGMPEHGQSCATWHSQQ